MSNITALQNISRQKRKITLLSSQMAERLHIPALWKDLDTICSSINFQSPIILTCYQSFKILLYWYLKPKTLEYSDSKRSLKCWKLCRSKGSYGITKITEKTNLSPWMLTLGPTLVKITPKCRREMLSILLTASQFSVALK